MLTTVGQKMYGVYLNMKNRVKNEKGAELMEWIGMTLVVIAIIGAIIAFFDKGSDSGIGSKISEFIKTQIENLTNGGE